jgi:hypothetical protein
VAALKPRTPATACSVRMYGLTKNRPGMKYPGWRRSRVPIEAPAANVLPPQVEQLNPALTGWLQRGDHTPAGCGQVARCKRYRSTLHGPSLAPCGTSHPARGRGLDRACKRRAVAVAMTYSVEAARWTWRLKLAGRFIMLGSLPPPPCGKLFEQDTLGSFFIYGSTSRMQTSEGRTLSGQTSAGGPQRGA